MNNSILEKFTIERNLIYVLIGAVVIVFIIVVYLFVAYGTKSVEIISPNGEEEWEIGQTYEITWKSRRIEKVGIVLFGPAGPEWIAQNIDAKLGRYQWEIYQGHEYGDNFWVAVFEYPWQKGNKLDYTNASFAITYPFLDTCDVLSIFEEWPYVASDFPEIRRVFITEENYTGNLGGFDGADEKCEQQAQALGFEGNWIAFLGGDSDNETAIKRLELSSRGIEGIFVQAKPSFDLMRKATCHRLLGTSFNNFWAKFSDLVIINAGKIEKEFLENMANIWLGRVDEKSKKNCTSIAAVVSDYYRPLAERYSFSTTCQNWTNGDSFVGGYPVPSGQPKPTFPTCYTPSGTFTEAVASAGLSSGASGAGEKTVFTIYQGKFCNARQKLLCIEQ